MAKLNRDKTQEIKDLLIQQESLKDFNETIKHKLGEEKDKFDKLVDSKMTLEEEKRLLEIHYKEDDEFLKV